MTVSVLIFCYNQENFIADAILSVLRQTTNFKVQIIIADDGSNDSTIEIIKEIDKAYPGKLTILKSERNGLFNNILRVQEHITGKYIAILDGDDYWTYNNKLQEQVDFLNTHLDFIGTFHDAEIKHYDGADKCLFESKKSYSQTYNYPSVIYPRDIINRLILPTASCLIRKEALLKIDMRAVSILHSFDWGIYCYIIKNSKFNFINKSWSVYRNHSKGISKSNNQQFHLSHIQFLENLLKDDYYHFYAYEIYQAIANEYMILIESGKDNKKKKLFRKYLCCELRKLWHYRKRIKTNTLH